MVALYKACKAIVSESIDNDYLEECQGNLLSVYMSEYGDWQKDGATPKNCTDYLQGLPTVCTVPFENLEVLNKLQALGIHIPKTEKGIYTLLENYWGTCGYAFYKIMTKRNK